MKEVNCSIEFNPLSPVSVHRVFRRAGMLGFITLLFLLSGKFFDHRTTDVVVSGAFSGIMVYRGALLGLALLLLIPYFKKKSPWRVARDLWFLSLYVLVAVASTMWSLTPMATVGKSGELCVCFLIILVASSGKCLLDRSTALFNLVLYFLFWDVFLAFVGFAIGLESFFELSSSGFGQFTGMRIKGINLSANGVGVFSALLSVVIVNLFVNVEKKRKRLMIAYFMFLFALMLLSTSRTSLAIFLIGIVFLLYFRIGMRGKLMALLVLSFIGVFVYEIVEFLRGGQLADSFGTLSGRTIMWEYAFNWFLEHPFLGSGYGVGSRVLFKFVDTGMSEYISTVHNGFLEVLLSVGLIGGVPWFIAVKRYLISSVRGYMKLDGDIAVILCVWPALIINTVMSVGVGGRGNFLFLFLGLTLSIIRHHKMPKEDRFPTFAYADTNSS